MRIYFRVKAAGKRKPVLELVESSLPDQTRNLAEAITAIVTEQVERYNARETDQTLFPYLLPDQIDEQAELGKVGFQAAYDDRKADVQEAVQVALQAFEDGIYKVLVNEDVIEQLDQPIAWKPDTVLTFVRSTLLAGRMW